MLGRYHDNMFADVDNLSEAYKRIILDQERDSRAWRIFLLISLLFFMSAFYWPEKQVELLVMFFIMVVQALVYFVDMSNRNFLLHIIDYHEWKDWHRKQRRET